MVVETRGSLVADEEGFGEARSRARPTGLLAAPAPGLAGVRAKWKSSFHCATGRWLPSPKLGSAPSGPAPSTASKVFERTDLEAWSLPSTVITEY